MPWKKEKDPYKIWLSEVILQQTRVEQGMKYYLAFTESYPRVEDLATAADDEIFKKWEGLGYYSRCKNLIVTARYILKELQGEFPKDYGSLLKLKGIGPYTAAAIASFAFDLPHAVVDGNVMRVLSRFFANALPIDSTEGKKAFAKLADELLYRDAPAEYNQAIMDFGATVCKPQNPACASCPLSGGCIAFSRQSIADFPVKSKTLTRKKRWFYYILAEEKNHFFVRKRERRDIWENLYEFILVEKDDQLSTQQLEDLPQVRQLTVGEGKIVHRSKIYTQQLTHQTIQGEFLHIRAPKIAHQKGYEKLSRAAIAALPFPKLITGYFDERTDLFGAKF